MKKTTRSRDEAEFTLATREALAKRAGYRCSFPRCGVPTLGPSAEAADRTAASGMACHIEAAAAGPSARRVSTAPPAKLSDISNGIWMCYRHGKLIDADEATYTVAQLNQWRVLAERRAALAHERGQDVPLWQDEQVHKLAKTEKALASTEELGAAVHTILTDGSAFEVWGEDPTLAIRDLLIELARNAFDHGGASAVSITVEARGIRFADDGEPFGLSDLRDQAAPGGGVLALRALNAEQGAHVIASGRREDGRNVVYLAAVRRAADLVAATPCHLHLTARGHLEQTALKGVVDCDTVYLISRAFWSYSDMHAIRQSVRAARDTGKAVTVATPRMSRGVREMVGTMFSDVTVIELPDKPGHPYA